MYFLRTPLPGFSDSVPVSLDDRTGQPTLSTIEAYVTAPYDTPLVTGDEAAITWRAKNSIESSLFVGHVTKELCESAPPTLRQLLKIN